MLLSQPFQEGISSFPKICTFGHGHKINSFFLWQLKDWRSYYFCVPHVCLLECAYDMQLNCLAKINLFVRVATALLFRSSLCTAAFDCRSCIFTLRLISDSILRLFDWSRWYLRIQLTLGQFVSAEASNIRKLTFRAMQCTSIQPGEDSKIISFTNILMPKKFEIHIY